MIYLKNKFRFLYIAAIFVFCAALPAQARTKVACIGNSITYGMLLPSPEIQSYPAQLSQMLGDNYEVRNFGHSGAAVLRKGHHPYTETSEYAAALAYKPDIAVIHLGVNDTDPRSWPNFSEEFTSDYLYIIKQLREANPNIRILIAKLTPLSASHPRFRTGTRIWRLEAQEYIEHIASDAKVELIDFNEPLVYRQDLLSDGIHPNMEGATLLAKEAYKGITGQYGPLSMPAIYSSGMVLPHSRYLTLHGTANAFSPIRLTIGGHTYRTHASNLGKWQVTIPPLTPGKEYTVTVTDEKDTLHLSNILAGVVFLASGQSNMAFTLAEDSYGQQAIDTATDSLLRFYAMQPRFMTNNISWTPEQVDSVNSLQYFQTTSWHNITPDNAAPISAVAYYFARELRDSLHMPVGIIQNAVGGATIESWIDINTIEQVMPELLLNWRTNDYVQPWAQQRAILNSGINGRHPYEPSYLFSAGIDPLGHYPIDGVIWYQGESNAHNIELHTNLFKAFTQSWRRYFSSPDLPIYFAQLSGINRPSWPKFRNSQRLLEHEVPNTAMAVTHDWGDSLDVHPRHKQPVGHRLALLALHHSFGIQLEAHGPQPLKAENTPQGLCITFTHAHGLSTSNGKEPITFEVAGANRVFQPAKAKISDNKIIIYDMEISDPRFVRYGWQPFTRANLINSDSLPASTFELEVENTPLSTIEPGIEAGLSGCFAARSGSRLILAGGCNFPGNPFAPNASKKFYKGIYAADTTAMEWQLIGELPEPTAYGATALIPEGIVLIGGTSPTSALSSCYLMKVTDTGVSVVSLPSLPAAIDNASAAAIGRKIYLAGGNADGVPSRNLYMLDMDASDPAWVTLASMPGNPRVQPVMASADGKLYIFGGFAGRYGKHQPTLELNGLCYNPENNKWTKIAGPETPDGEPLAVGGGAACTLSCGKIAVCGGVNKDVFLEALRNQAPDYLDHDPSWYRFNPYLLIFDPAVASWCTPVNTGGVTSRAGAAIFPGLECDFYLYGGELKPRVRTSDTVHITI